MHGEDGRVWHQYPAGTGMSIRQYAAIHLRVPDSGVPELDAMIEKARRQEMVTQVLAGLISNEGPPARDKDACRWADNLADAVIKAIEEKP